MIYKKLGQTKDGKFEQVIENPETVLEFIELVYKAYKFPDKYKIGKVNLENTATIFELVITNSLFKTIKACHKTLSDPTNYAIITVIRKEWADDNLKEIK